MKMYSVLISVDASTQIEVEAENEEQAKQLAMNAAETPSICHYCAKNLDVGDLVEAIEATEIV